MIIDFQYKDTLPPLAWAACHSVGSDFVHVIVGNRVSTQPDIFWEGPNVRPSEPHEIAAHHLSLVTGGMIDGSAIKFFTPGHVLDRLCYTKVGGSFHISNSLPFLLAQSGNNLRPKYLHYASHFRKIIEHVQAIPGTISDIFLLSGANIRITRNHSERIEHKQKSPEFSNFKEYRDRIDEWLDEIDDALQHEANFRFRPMTTISSGYDSTAVSVLARRVGVTDALTIEDARKDALDDLNDSGREIGEQLGLNVISTRREAYQRHGIKAELPFNFAGTPEDLPFFEFSKYLDGALLFNGVHGDTVWNRVTRLRHWRRLDACGASMQEFRLHAGFAHAPLPFFGCDRHETIISN